MLDGVGREVDLQGGGVRVGPVAVGTLVGLVLVVLALVRLCRAQQGIRSGQGLPPPPTLCSLCWQGQVDTHLEVGQLSESLFAARMWALVGSVACVDSVMGNPVRWSPPVSPQDQLQLPSSWLAMLVPQATPSLFHTLRVNQGKSLGTSKTITSLSGHLPPLTCGQSRLLPPSSC